KKLTLRADVEVTLLIEGKVGTRQDALFPLAHVPNRDVRHDAGADDPMEELASAVRRVCGQPFGLEPQSLVRPFNHRLCGSNLIISAGWRSLYVDDNRVLDVDEIIEPIAKLDALVGLRGPGRTRVNRRDYLWRPAISVSVFIIEGRKELCDGARLALGRRPVPRGALPNGGKGSPCGIAEFWTTVHRHKPGRCRTYSWVFQARLRRRELSAFRAASS